MVEVYERRYTVLVQVVGREEQAVQAKSRMNFFLRWRIEASNGAGTETGATNLEAGLEILALKFISQGP
jgi:hypothetical protein